MSDDELSQVREGSTSILAGAGAGAGGGGERNLAIVSDVIVFMHFEQSNEHAASSFILSSIVPATTSLLNARPRVKSRFRWGVWRFPDSKHDTPGAPYYFVPRIDTEFTCDARGLTRVGLVTRFVRRLGRYRVGAAWGCGESRWLLECKNAFSSALALKF